MGTYVKANRKIYLTINGENPPNVRMPRLIDGSVRNALLLLKNKGLHLGEISYTSDLVTHAVLQQYYQGKPIAAGEWLPRGAKIDLEVGKGLGEAVVVVPDLIGKSLPEVKLSLLDVGIRLGVVHYEVAPECPLDKILNQSPPAGTKLQIGDSMDLWLAGIPYQEPLEDEEVGCEYGDHGG